MRQHLPGLNEALCDANDGLPDGIFVVNVKGARFNRCAQRSFYVLHLRIVEPSQFKGRPIVGRLYCSPKALWRLTWFLRDFGYDSECFERNEIDGNRLVDLRGVVKIRHTIVNGNPLVNFDAFAPAGEWPVLADSPALKREAGGGL